MGRSTLRGAIVESCDVYFYQLALDLGIERIHQKLVEFGLGRPTGVDLLGESPGWCHPGIGRSTLEISPGTRARR